jgi:hypothetical protein
MEPFEGWERGPGYEQQKTERSAKLYEALERVIPDIRERVVGLSKLNSVDVDPSRLKAPGFNP